MKNIIIYNVQYFRFKIADGPPPPRAQEYMLTEIIKFVAAQGVYAEFLGW
jgi:hypothetical protein